MAGARRRTRYESRRSADEVLDGILPQRDCDHRKEMRLVANCDSCQAYAQRRLDRGLVRNPWRIPF